MEDTVTKLCGQKVTSVVRFTDFSQANQVIPGAMVTVPMCANTTTIDR